MRPGKDDELKDVIELLNDNSIIVEIGSFAEESASIFSKSDKIIKLFCIDSWVSNYDCDDPASKYDMQIIENEFDKRHKTNPKIIKIKQKSDDAVKYFSDKSLDMVYIDGDHRYEQIKKDIINYLPKIKYNGIICGHDYETLGVNLAVKEMFGKPDKFLNYGNWVKFI